MLGVESSMAWTAIGRLQDLDLVRLNHHPEFDGFPQFGHVVLSGTLRPFDAIKSASW